MLSVASVSMSVHMLNCALRTKIRDLPCIYALFSPLGVNVAHVISRDCVYLCVCVLMDVAVCIRVRVYVCGTRCLGLSCETSHCTSHSCSRGIKTCIGFYALWWSCPLCVYVYMPELKYVRFLCKMLFAVYCDLFYAFECCVLY